MIVGVGLLIILMFVLFAIYCCRSRAAAASKSGNAAGDESEPTSEPSSDPPSNHEPEIENDLEKNVDAFRVDAASSQYFSPIPSPSKIADAVERL